jgi:hypothetical protein
LGDDLPIRDLLEDLLADLVSEKKYVSFLKRLFSFNPGDWQSAASLCGDMPVIERLRELENLADDSIYVMWVNYPGEHDDRYCLIVFYLEALILGSFAIYNKSMLEKWNS